MVPERRRSVAEDQGRLGEERLPADIGDIASDCVVGHIGQRGG